MHSVFCKHGDNTVSMTADEKARHLTQPIEAWLATWLDASPAGEDEPLRNSHESRECRQVEPRPQQLPESWGYPDVNGTEEQNVFPTDAKAREKDRRKALTASGTAHVVKKRIVEVENMWMIVVKIGAICLEPRHALLHGLPHCTKIPCH